MTGAPLLCRISQTASRETRLARRGTGRIGRHRQAAADVRRRRRPRARASGAAAWECLVARLSVLPWSVARAHRLPEADSADVVQSTWLRLLENLDAVSNAERLPGWLATTARRECLRSLRRSGQVLPVDQLTAHDLPDERLEPLDAGLLRAERDLQPWGAFTELPAGCQALLRLLLAAPAPSYEDLAVALGRPLGAIGPTRGRCLRRLRVALEQLARGTPCAGQEGSRDDGRTARTAGRRTGQRRTGQRRLDRRGVAGRAAGGACAGRPRAWWRTGGGAGTFEVRDLDQELATLVADSASALGSPAPVRALLTLRTLSFEASDTGVELELSAAGKRFDLQGQVLGGVRGPVVVDHSEGAAQAGADALGWFEVRAVGAGRLRVRWTDGAGRPTATAWFET